MAWTQNKMDEVYLLARNLAVTDKKFRTELLSNPVLTIEKLSGESLPENFSIRLIESDPAYSATFVLPPVLSSELSDDELDNVAGGTSGQGTTCGTQVVK